MSTGYSPEKHASQYPGVRTSGRLSRKPSRLMNASESAPIQAHISSFDIFAAMSWSRVSVSMP